MNTTPVSRLSIALAILLLIFSTFGTSQAQTAVSTPPEVKLSGTQLLHLNSAIVGQEYDLFISLPRGYPDMSKSFPVIFLLDGQWDFPLAHAIYGSQYYDGFLPAAIIVGITWGGVRPNHDSLRARDFTPTNIRQLPQSGGAPRFLKFMKEELVPFIDSKFRTTKNGRTLMGSSLGGLFTLYALLHETALFERYVLTSPAVGWDNEILYTYEKEYAAKSSQLPARLFIGVGGFEGDGVTGVQKFVAQLKSRKYRGLELETKVLDGIGHSGSKAEGYTRGLQAVFARPSLTLPDGILDRYLGKYEVAPQFVLEVVKDNGNLFIVAPGNGRIPILAESESKFYVKGQYLLIQFKKDEVGQVTGVEAEQYGGTQFAKKIK